MVQSKHLGEREEGQAEERKRRGRHGRQGGRKEGREGEGRKRGRKEGGGDEVSKLCGLLLLTEDASDYQVGSAVAFCM